MCPARARPTRQAVRAPNHSTRDRSAGSSLTSPIRAGERQAFLRTCSRYSSGGRIGSTITSWKSSPRCGKWVGCVRATPEGLHTPYVRPHENGNRADVRWAADSRRPTSRSS
ncbi:hypothetical protein [Kitasatospora sp. CMC57]|uniref:hypothetical protein n=1 Tax=Kitasatospora sp. CMC57 TaxID=3231513 RepID=UPI0038B4C731